MKKHLGRSTPPGFFLVCALLLAGCAADSAKPSGSGSGTAGSFGNTGAGASASGNGGTGTGSAGNFVHTGEGQGCATADVRAARVTPTIWLVVDGSGSMSEPFGTSDRWTSLREALMEPTTGVVPTLQAAVIWGLVEYDGPIDIGAFFGMPTAGACPRLVVVEPTLNNFAAMDPAYPAAPLGGSTPTHNALDAVLTRVTTPAPSPDGIISPTYVVLATDGQPNDMCSGGIGADASPLVLAAAQKIADTGTKMYVISLAGGDAALQAHLEQVAMIGGTGKPPFTPMSKDDLVKTFEEIVGGAVGCQIHLNGKVTLGSECSGYVNVGGAGDLPCNDPNGWHLKDEQTVEITGTACDAFKANKEASLHASFPCDVFTPD